MKLFFRVTRLILAGLLLAGGSHLKAQAPTAKVDPFMGVTGRGNTVIGPQLPWGSISPSPDTPEGGSDGYNPQKRIRGFSQLHVTGTGSYGKYGQFLLSPQIGLNPAETGHDSDKADETAGVAQYRVRLKSYDIFCELTPTAHAALYRFTFPRSTNAYVLLDLAHNIPGNLFRAGLVEEGAVFVDPTNHIIRGWGNYWGGWSAEAVRLYFACRYSASGTAFGTWKNSSLTPGVATQTGERRRDGIGAYVRFATTTNQPVLFKIAVSFTSMDRAQEFLDREIPDWDYDKVRDQALAIWNEQLGKIQLEGATPDEQTIFYTSLYNTMRMPKDRTGDNPAWSSSEPYWDDHYCVWDTWKTLFPLDVLLHESMVRDNVRAFIDRYRHNGEVQDAFIGGNDRYYKWTGENNPEWLGNQGGDDVDNIIADACAKDVAGVDWNAAYDLIKHDADTARAPSYRAENRGWVPYRKFQFGLYCSRSLEFSYNDYCAALMARKLGHSEDATTYRQRSRNWEQLWNPATESDGFKGFITPRWLDGNWLAYNPKDDRPATSPGGVDRSFYEGSSWVYSYFIPHDFARLITLSGGAEAYCTRLQHALQAELIDFSNEPSFLTPYSFIYAGRPDLCSLWVRKNAASYTRTGFPGDEDGGAMSAWYVFAALGFFPNAGQDIYLLNGPMYPKATLTMENGRQIVIEGVNAGPENIYVQSLTVNGKPWPRAWLRHGDLKEGATLRFVMGPQPSDWGRQEVPPSASTE